MKVLVTGGAGYVGTELVRELASRPQVHEIIVYDNLSRRNPSFFLLGPRSSRPILGEGSTPKPIRFVRGDLLDTRKLEAALDGVDVVYHLAAKVSTPFADQDFHGFDQVNHWGTAELIYLLERRKIERLIYLSSTSVYGASEQDVTEQTAPDPTTTYGLSKREGERMLERLAGSLALYTFRCGNVYGYSPSMRFDAVVNRYVFEAHFSGRITVHGSGRQHRAFVHVGNVTRALVAALDHIEPGTYNLVERNLSVLDVAAQVRALYPELETLFIQQDVKLRDLRVRPDPRLANAEIFDGRGFPDQLREFQQHFSFGPPGRG